VCHQDTTLVHTQPQRSSHSADFVLEPVQLRVDLAEIHDEFAVAAGEFKCAFVGNDGCDSQVDLARRVAAVLGDVGTVSRLFRPSTDSRRSALPVGVVRLGDVLPPRLGADATARGFLGDVEPRGVLASAQCKAEDHARRRLDPRRNLLRVRTYK
jgi:hypothetical protein